MAVLVTRHMPATEPRSYTGSQTSSGADGIISFPSLISALIVIGTYGIPLWDNIDSVRRRELSFASLVSDSQKIYAVSLS